MNSYCTEKCPFSSCVHQQLWVSLCSQQASDQLVSSHTYTPPTSRLSFTHCWLPWRSDPCWANLRSRGEGGVGGKCIVGKKGAEATPAVYIQIKWGNSGRRDIDIQLKRIWQNGRHTNKYIDVMYNCTLDN